MSKSAMSYTREKLKNIFNKAGRKDRFPLALSVTMFTNMIFYSMVSTVLFSFSPKMVKHFGASEVDTGTYAGLLATTFYIGQFFFSMLWGYIADTMIKTHALMIAGSALIVTTILFGLSLNFYWALVTRFFQGSAMGHLILFKAIVVEVCDEKDTAFGLSILMSAFTIGSILGPSIGGFLAFPGEQYPEDFSKYNVFSKFGILLPNLILAIGVGVGMILAVMFVPRRKKDTIVKPEEKTTLISSRSPNYGTLNNENEEVQFSTKSDFLQKIKDSKLYRTLTTKEALLTCFLYALFSMADIGYNEILPVLTSTSSSYRGIDFTPSQIGTLLMIAPGIYFIPQFTVIPKLTTRIGARKTFIAANLVLVLAYPLLPTVSAIQNSTGIYVCLITIIVFVRMSVFGGSLSINLLVNNSVDPDLLGTVNGVAMSTAALGRMTAPVMFGGIYSWSLKNIVGIKRNESPLGFPFNQFLTFFVLSLLSLIIALITTILPKSIDNKKS